MRSPSNSCAEPAIQSTSGCFFYPNAGTDRGVEITLKKLGVAGFRDLPTSRSYNKIDKVVSLPVDETLECGKRLPYVELAERGSN
jgi:hypothetical protein